MGLSISKRRPKYTPPKVCKKSATVLLPSWNFVQCPDVNTLTLRVMFPSERLGSPKDVTMVYKAYRTAPCHWEQLNGIMPGAHGTALMEVTFEPAGPFLDITVGYQWDPLRDFGYNWVFGDYDSRKPKLLLPSPLPPDGVSDAEHIAMVTITI